MLTTYTGNSESDSGQVGRKEPGSNWCSRFVERHKAELNSRAGFEISQVTGLAKAPY
jgi:hypothetical protein